MRPRKTENRDLPPGMVRRKRPRKNGTVWLGYYYRDANGKELSLGSDFDKARLKWAELEAKAKPADRDRQQHAVAQSALPQGRRA